MYIIIPACGRGERFKAAGYATVKPLISVYGESMIDKVISTLHLRADDDLYVVSNWGEAGSHKTITLEHETAGATETVLLALKELFKESKAKSDAPLLLLDCDAIYHCDVLSKFRELVSEASIRAAALCFEENEDEKESTPKFSYLIADGSGLVSEVKEKVRIGPLANTGAYWFASTKEFMQVADSIIQTADFQLGEAYISCVLKAYLSKHLSVKAVKIFQTNYANVGTPACLEIYLQQQGKGFLFDLDGTLADTTAAYVKAWQKLIASKGAYVDEEFFVDHISGLSDSLVSAKFGFPISSSEKDSEFLRNISLVKNIQGSTNFVRSCQGLGKVAIVTNSNKAAATALLNGLDLNDILLITAEDVAKGKPNPDPYVLAMKLLGVSPTRCMVFEDTKGGMISARAAQCRHVVSVSNELTGSDAFLRDYSGINPSELLESLESVSHLGVELTGLLGKHSTVYPVRASGGYISEILSASCGSRKMVIKQENSDHGVLQAVSQSLDLHNTECIFYQKFAHISPIRIPTCYGILPDSSAIVMDDLRRYDRAPEFTLESGLKVVKTIAKFHAHFRGAPLDKLAEPKRFMRTYVLQNYSAFKSKWADSISSDTWVLFDHAVEYYADAEKQLLLQPNTLLHGDLKFPNLFWDNSSSGGEPIFIDWQYAGPGNGIEDIVFLLVESCKPGKLEELARPIINSYYDEIQKHEETSIPSRERFSKASCALAGFPLFVAVWFGCIDASKLTDPNFPFLYILRLRNAFDILYDRDWVQFTH